MGRFLPALVCAAALSIILGCSASDKNKARQEMHDFGQKVNQAVGPVDLRDTQSAAAKLRKGEDDLRVAGEKAGVKLDHATLIARVKTKLATDIGFSTATGITVDAHGPVITLSGSVSSEDQKQKAAESASQVGGVDKVVNDLRIRP